MNGASAVLIEAVRCDSVLFVFRCVRVLLPMMPSRNWPPLRSRVEAT